jgi:replicative DNA helicase
MANKSIEELTAERALVAMVVKYPEMVDRVGKILTPAEIGDQALSLVFQTCVDLTAAGKQYRWESLAPILQHVDQRPVDLDVPSAYLAGLVVGAPEADQYEFFARLLLEKRSKLLAVDAAEKFKQLVADPASPVEELYHAAHKIIDCFNQLEISGVVVGEPETFWNTISPGIEQIMRTSLLGTGYERIDRYLTFGFVPGVSAVAGRPSMGKSTFRANVQRLLSSVGHQTITIAREQSLLDEYFRQISIRTGMSVPDMVRGLRAAAQGKTHEQFNHEMFEKAVDYLSSPKRPHIYLEPRGAFYLKDIPKYVEQARKQGTDPKIIFVDLFNQLDDFTGIYDPGKKAGLIAQKMVEVGNMARRIQTHICCVVQLKRMGKDRGKIDRQELYAESGAYEQRCDLMFQVERPAKYKPDELVDNSIEIYIGKQRMGTAARTVKLLWEPECMRISDEAPPSAAEEDELGGGF